MPYSLNLLIKFKRYGVHITFHFIYWLLKFHLELFPISFYVNKLLINFVKNCILFPSFEDYILKLIKPPLVYVDFSQ